MKQRYDQSFREEAVRLSLTGDKTIARTAKDLGIKETTLYTWIHKARRSQSKIVLDDDEPLTSGQALEELTRLRKENVRLKEEREILKKAAAFFAKEEQRR
jgi:transposase